MTIDLIVTSVGHDWSLGFSTTDLDLEPGFDIT